MRSPTSALGVHADERRVAALVALLMFVSTWGATIGESASGALFFERIGTQALPLMYLAQAGVTLVAMFALTTVLERVRHRTVYIWSPVLLAVVVLAERGILATDVRWIYPVLWVTVAFATLAQAIGLWGTAGAVVDARQAKRLFPIFGAGGILGAVVGGLLTRPLADLVGAEDLLLFWVAALVAAGALCRTALGPRGAASAPVRRRGSLLHDVQAGYAYVRRSPLLRAMAVAAVLFSVLFFSLYLPFATVSTERFSDAEDLAGFFGVIGATITGGAFLFSILLTNRLFVRFGVATMMLVLPALYLGAFALLLVASGFVAVVAMRVLTGVWLQGVASPAWETLVNVVPDDRRDQTRAFLNGGPAQVGTAIAGVVALVGQDVLTGRQLALIGLVAALLTLWATWVIRRSFADALLRALLAARPQVFRTATAWTTIPLDVDAQARQVLIDGMHADDVRIRRSAFELAASVGSDRLAGEMATGVTDPDPVVRLAAARSLDVATPAAREALLGLLDDPYARVAAVAAAKAAGMPDDAGRRRLDELLGDADPRVRRVAVEELAAAPRDLAAERCEALFDDPDPQVRAAALDRVAGSAPERALAPAERGLRDPDPMVRVAAGRALGAAGAAGTAAVLGALGDRTTAIAGIEAARRLDLRGDTEPVVAFLRSVAARTEQDRAFVAAIPDTTDAEAFLRDAVLDRGRRGSRSGLWAASMVVGERHVMTAAIDRLDGPPPLRASAIETLETVGPTTLIRPLLAMWEPIRPAASDDGAWLTRALDDDDGHIRRCAQLVRARREGDTMALTTLMLLERALLLRAIPLFADLSPADLEEVARIGDEQGYADGEVIAREGELGDAMHVVIEGVIRVVQDADGDERELARRGAGEFVGEMSIITRKPRVASLIADGEVRTIRIGQASFESMLRERPDLAIGVMRVLADRLAESAS